MERVTNNQDRPDIIVWKILIELKKLRWISNGHDYLTAHLHYYYCIIIIIRIENGKLRLFQILVARWRRAHATNGSWIKNMARE